MSTNIDYAGGQKRAILA